MSADRVQESTTVCDALPDKAEELLRQQADSTTLMNLGVACHTRMLELDEQDRGAAIQHALAGAALFEAVQRRAASPPDWLAAHDEQCCRYGAIWIHAWLQTREPLESHWPATALHLLERMQQHHPEPLAWASTMAVDLRSRLPADTPPTDSRASLKLAVVGNCQSHPLMLGLQQALPGARLHYCPPVHMAEAADVERLHHQLRHADRLVAQRVQPGYRNNIGLDTATLCSLLPSGAEAVVLPNVHYEGHHPWIGYAHDPDGRLAELESRGETPLGAYHDFLAMAAASQGVDAATLLSTDPPAALLQRLRDGHQQSLAELRQREQDCTIPISDWIAEHHQQQPIAHTINHPTQASLDQLLRRLLSQLGQPHQLGDALFDQREHLGELSIPIHPWVRQALELGPWAERWGQQRGTPLPIEQQLSAAIAFYQQHPWIAAANTHHPKFQLAQACLSLLPRLADVLQLRAYRCAGSTLSWSLARATGGRLLQLQTDTPQQRQTWQEGLEQLRRQPTRVIRSDQISPPPSGQLALLTVMLLRDPLDRLQAIQASQPGLAMDQLLEWLWRSPLANEQTRLLSPQEEDWALSQGWAARPELIDLQRPDLFVGLVERYDDSMLALEQQLEQLGCPLDLAYPAAWRPTAAGPRPAATERPIDPRLLAVTELDLSLHRRATARLEQRLAELDDLAARRAAFQERCSQLNDLALDPPPSQPPQRWLDLLSHSSV